MATAKPRAAMDSTPAATLLRIFMDNPVLIVKGKGSIRAPVTYRQAADSETF
nr:hypothetical protein KPHV_17070 [Kitasatospora purpeofusca]